MTFSAKKRFLHDLERFTLQHPTNFALPSSSDFTVRQLKWFGLIEAVASVFVIIGLPLLAGTYGATLLPRLFHPHAKIVFSMGSELVLIVVIGIDPLIVSLKAFIYWMPINVRDKRLIAFS